MSPTPATIPVRRAANSTWNDNYWSAGRGGVLVKFDTKEKRIHEYPLPTPYASMYTAMADKNGEVWGGGGPPTAAIPFDPKKQYTEYVLPEPYGLDRESWIDNSTDPVTVWYVDHQGYIVRIQPTGIAAQGDASALRRDQRVIDLEQPRPR